jgi:hypothetical protein
VKILYVEIVDSWGAFNDLQYGCSGTSSRKRVVKIELTPDQEKLIEPKECGSNCGNKMFETVNVLCIQDDPTEPEAKDADIEPCHCDVCEGLVE